MQNIQLCYYDNFFPGMLSCPPQQNRNHVAIEGVKKMATTLPSKILENPHYHTQEPTIIWVLENHLGIKQVLRAVLSAWEFSWKRLRNRAPARVKHAKVPSIMGWIGNLWLILYILVEIIQFSLNVCHVPDFIIYAIFLPLQSCFESMTLMGMESSIHL